jgi:lysyl-tRNA synthetase class I
LTSDIAQEDIELAKKFTARYYPQEVHNLIDPETAAARASEFDKTVKELNDFHDKVENEKQDAELRKLENEKARFMGWKSQDEILWALFAEEKERNSKLRPHTWYEFH